MTRLPSIDENLDLAAQEREKLIAMVRSGEAIPEPDPNIMPSGRPFRSLFNYFVYKAKIRKIECAITYEQFVAFTEERLCHYCHSGISWARSSTNLNGFAYNLDRKDSCGAYVLGNVVVCCARCNMSKRDIFSYEEWFGMTAHFRPTLATFGPTTTEKLDGIGPTSNNSELKGKKAKAS
jgi:hypothetical protein